MGNKISRRLILVPQYPAKLRYQEWWLEELPKNFSHHFEEVLSLDPSRISASFSSGTTNTNLSGHFTKFKDAIEWELKQCQQYLDLKISESDILLICDISFAGIFPQILLHKKPKHVFGICHATSLNRFDYFQKLRKQKFKIEAATMDLLDAVFVATEYHREKILRKAPHLANKIIVTSLPLPPFPRVKNVRKNRIFPVVSLSRPTKQKVNKKLEKFLSKRTGIKIMRPPSTITSWSEYYNFIRKSKIVLITSKEETFGYQILDAILNRSIPVVPDALSFPELVPPLLRYRTKEDLVQLVPFLLEYYDDRKWSRSPIMKMYPIYEQSKRFYLTVTKIIKALIT